MAGNCVSLFNTWLRGVGGGVRVNGYGVRWRVAVTSSAAANLGLRWTRKWQIGPLVVITKLRVAVAVEVREVFRVSKGRI